ncbi:MAG: hypothetical protein VX313_04455, partial [Bacteroidota bacterium]|nr:hypothetical protein [Bacteroidota bacterium]
PHVFIRFYSETFMPLYGFIVLKIGHDIISIIHKCTTICIPFRFFLSNCERVRRNASGYDYRYDQKKENSLHNDKIIHIGLAWL